MAKPNRNPFIDYSPKIEVKPTRDAGEVTEGRKEALAKSRKLKKESETKRNKNMKAFSDMTDEERIQLRIQERKENEAREAQED
jgi:hypothetical protein